MVEVVEFFLRKEFTVIDLGNNLLRFGLWDSYVDWQKIFKSPNYYLENIKSDEDIEMEFISAMSDAVRAKFPSENVEFDVRKEYKTVVRQGLKSKEALNRAMEQHAKYALVKKMFTMLGHLLIY